MTAEEYLKQIERINQRIKRLQMQRDDLRDDLYSIGSPFAKMGADKVQ